MNNGSWTPDNVLKDISNMAYQGIRKTNIFLENVAKVPMDESKRAGWIGEATFLRAFFHFQLLRIYGPIHITEKVFDPNEDFSELCKRMPLDQCVDFITNECDKAGGMLKMKEGADRYGRVTKAAAMALKARALLYRASPCGMVILIMQTLQIKKEITCSPSLMKRNVGRLLPNIPKHV